MSSLTSRKQHFCSRQHISVSCQKCLTMFWLRNTQPRHLSVITTPQTDRPCVYCKGYGSEIGQNDMTLSNVSYIQQRERMGGRGAWGRDGLRTSRCLSYINTSLQWLQQSTFLICKQKTSRRDGLHFYLATLVFLFFVHSRVHAHYKILPKVFPQLGHSTQRSNIWVKEL